MDFHGFSEPPLSHLTTCKWKMLSRACCFVRVGGWGGGRGGGRITLGTCPILLPALLSL